MAVAPPDQHANYLLIGISIGHVIASVFHLEQSFFKRNGLAALMLIGTENARAGAGSGAPNLAVMTRGGFPQRNFAQRHRLRRTRLGVFRAGYLNRVRP